MSSVLGKTEGEEIFFPGILGENGSGLAVASFEAVKAYANGKNWTELWDKENHGKGFPNVMLFPQTRDGVKGHVVRRYIFKVT